MMMKIFALFAMLVYIAECQRPPYAGSSNRYPQVLPQFIEAQAAAAGIGSRIDATDNATASPPTSTTVPPNLPVDAMGDVDLVNRISQWPRDKQPFWYINSQQIEAHRGDSNAQQQQIQPTPNTRPFFAGRTAGQRT